MLDWRMPCVALRSRSLAVLLWALLFWAAPAYAATVVIVRPPNPSPQVTETLSRLHGELLSVGLEVEIADRPAVRGSGSRDSRAWLEELAADRAIDAVIDIVGDAAAVDVWVIDRSPRRFEVSRVTHDPDADSASEKLAIRAIEVLRSSFLESDWAARERQRGLVVGTPTASLEQAGTNGSGEQPGRVGIELGAATLTSLDGVGPAILPLVRAGWAARPWLVLQATLAGLGSRPTVATTAGNARIGQQYGLLGACYRFRSERRLWPFFSVSAGVLRTSVEGQADVPKQGHSVTQWSFLMDGSLGAGLHLASRYYLALAAHAQVAAPYVAIHFVDSVVATSGRPDLLLTLAVGARL